MSNKEHGKNPKFVGTRHSGERRFVECIGMGMISHVAKVSLVRAVGGPIEDALIIDSNKTKCVQPWQKNHSQSLESASQDLA